MHRFFILPILVLPLKNVCMIRHLGSIIFCCFYFPYATGQNLVANSSFEDVNICESQIPCSPKGWHSVSNLPYGYANNLPDSYHKKRSLSFLIYSKKTTIKTYWQTALLCPLQQNEEYTIKLHIYSTSGQIDLSQIGILFTNQMIFSKNDTTIQNEASLSTQNVVLKKSKQQWHELSFQYKSNENAQYLMIGNFNTMEPSGRTLPPFIEYFIDQVSVVPLKKNICAEIKQRTDSLYSIRSRHANKFSSPNPAPSLTASPEIQTGYVTDTFTIDMQVFDFDSYRLKDTTQITNILQKIDRETIDTIYFNGYTDNTGSVEYNSTLSLRRATELKQFFHTRLGFPESRFIVKGKGVSTTYPDPALNRRVEIIIKRRTLTTEE